MSDQDHQEPIGCALTYEVSREAESLGRVTAANARGSVAPETLLERTCWETLAHRTTPCPGCPIREGRPGVTSLLVSPSQSEGRYALRSIEVSDHSLRVVCHCVGDQFLDALISERIEQVVRKAQLSPQERAVFDLVCLGLQAKEIATKMGLSPRTVKFQVTNILRKAGADSRVSLLRFLLMPPDGHTLDEGRGRP